MAKKQFYAGMPDYIERLNELGAAAYNQIQADWNAPADSVKAILNQPTLAAVATSGKKDDVGLGNVDNTADKDKPVSTAMAAALSGKADAAAMTTALASKADAAAMTTALASKAEVAVMVTALASKADTAAMTNALSGKADAATTTTALASKADAATMTTALNGKQAALGFSPVQQGGGISQGPNKVYIGWGDGGGKLKLTVDSTYLGNFAMENEANVFGPLQTFNNGASASSFSFAPTSAWKAAAYTCAGTYGGGIALIDHQGLGGGTIYAQGSLLRLAACTSNGPSGQALEVGANYIAPGVDRGMYLGLSNYRWDTVFSYTGSINTSDARWKTVIAPLGEAEMRWAAALAREIGTYQFLAEVENKGADTARLHCGMTVQRAIELGEEQGLDPLRYAFICHDSWDEKVEQFPAEYGPSVEHPAEYRAVAATDDEPARQVLVSAAYTEQGPLLKEASTVTTAAGDVYSFRTGELNLFITRGLAARLDALEARFAALELS